MDDLWPALKERFQVWTGMILPRTIRMTAVETVRRMAREARSTPADLLRVLDREPERRQVLLDTIGLGTTWFMRDQGGLFALVQNLARITPREQPVSMWSAGCASGEEPYSMAMAMAEAGMTTRILATDINRRALRRAFDGHYRTQAVERLPEGWRRRYFEDIGEGMVRVCDSIRQCVTFELHNFRNSNKLPAGWSRFDAVVCRNALIYFDRDEAVEVIDRLARACRPGGYLLLGAIERPLFWMSDVATTPSTAALVQVSVATPQWGIPVRATSVPVSINEQPTPRFAITGTLEPGRRSRRTTRDRMQIDHMLERAEAAEQAGRHDDALALIDIALARLPLSAPAHLARGLTLKRCGRIAEAIEAFRAARFLDDQAWLAPFQLAVCLETEGELQEAHEAYRHALGILESNGPPGLAKASTAVENLTATVSEVCQSRVRKASGSDSVD